MAIGIEQARHMERLSNDPEARECLDQIKQIPDLDYRSTLLYAAETVFPLMGDVAHGPLSLARFTKQALINYPRIVTIAQPELRTRIEKSMHSSFMPERKTRRKTKVDPAKKGYGTRETPSLWAYLMAQDEAKQVKESGLLPENSVRQILRNRFGDTFGNFFFEPESELIPPGEQDLRGAVWGDYKSLYTDLMHLSVTQKMDQWSSQWLKLQGVNVITERLQEIQLNPLVQIRAKISSAHQHQKRVNSTYDTDLTYGEAEDILKWFLQARKLAPDLFPWDLFQELKRQA